MGADLVRIEWQNPDHDWPYFRLLKVSQRDSTIRLKGIDYPDGSAKHDGTEFWADWGDVKSITPIAITVVP